MNQVVVREADFIQTIKEIYPDLDLHSARLHASQGQFNDILFINDDLIFRFPRYEENIPDFLREIKLLQKLQGHLNLPIPNPIYANAGTESGSNVFMGYNILPGKPLFKDVLHSIRDESTFEFLAQQLANFLKGLHKLSPNVLEIDLPLRHPLEESRQLFSDIEGYLFSFMRPEARDRVRTHFENYFSHANLHKYEPVIIHGDFGGSNILFEGKRISGVIDFSFAGLGDPAIDLAAVSTLGESFFDRFRRHYVPDEAMLERATFYRGTFALQEALHGFHHNDKEAFASGMEQYR